MNAPNFSLPDQDNKIHSLKDYKDKWVVLYFYPKDDTPGCTKEACGFRDLQKAFQEVNAVILGVSKDSPSSHRKFIEKFHLTFPLLSDESKETINDYHAWGPKKFMGKEYEGILRKTYLIDGTGEIKKIYENVNPTEHAEEIIKDIHYFNNE
jgi:peroxiredoxin Q/BCP